MKTSTTVAGSARTFVAGFSSSLKILKIASLALLFVAVFSVHDAKAQFFNVGLESNFGVAPLAAGFEPDPLEVIVIAGGLVDAAYLGGDCVGFGTEAPDYQVQWSGRSSHLRFIFEALDSEDTTLIINAPDGSWHCNDDAFSGTFDPMVIFNNPAEGRYDIWVGTYSANQAVTGSLFVTERPVNPGEMRAIADAVYGNHTSHTSSSSNVVSNAIYEDITLSAGFTPDPAKYAAVAGGTVDVSTALGSECVGFASEDPDFRLFWTGSTADLRIFFEADNDGDDTVLIIATPDDRWICNDDAHFNTLNPSIDLRGYPAGRFDIWIGTFREGEYLNGMLTITELDLQVK